MVAPQTGYLCRTWLAARAGRSDALTKENLGWPVEPPFLVPQEVEQHCHHGAVELGNGSRMERDVCAYEKQYPELARELRLLITGELPPGWDANIPQFPADAKGLATRVASGEIVCGRFRI